LNRALRAGIALVSIGAGMGTAAATPTCRPVVGHFEATVVPPGEAHCPPVSGVLCTSGRVWGGIQGTYQFGMTGASSSAAIGGVPTILFFTGRSTVFLNGGNVLRGIDTGSIDVPPGRGGFASLITFDGGTGDMHGATGQVGLRGDFDAAAGTTKGDYIGELCRQ
jgi:hypothetical protein